MVNHQPLLSRGVKQPGFFYGYIIVLASFLILLIVAGSLYSFGVFFKPLLNEFGWTRAATSVPYALFMVLSGFLSIFTGRLCDRFGPRLIVTISGFFIGLSYLLMATVSTIWQIYLFYGVLLSIGMAGIMVPLPSIVARWFSDRRGLATGITLTGAGVGTVIMPPLANQLILSYSWRMSYVIIGLIALVLIISFAQFLRRYPNQKGFFACGTNALITYSPDLPIHDFSPREALRTRQFWMISVAYSISFFCIQTVMVHVVPYATDIGVPVAAAATILSTIGILSIGGKIGMGSVGDRIGNKRAMIIIFFIILLSFLWLNLTSDLWMLYLFAIVFGIAYGGFAAVSSPLVAEYFGLRAHGIILGLATFALNTGGAIGSLVSGCLFDINSSYYWAFILCAILSVVGLILTILLKTMRK